MNPVDAPSGAGHEPGRDAHAPSIPELVAEVYELAPAVERARLLEQLMRPLGVLSLVAVAGGIFAGVRLRSGWPEPKVRLDDLREVRAEHVVALVDHAQQVSVEAVDGLAQVLMASPVLAGSAAAAMLMAALVRRARSRTSGVRRIENPWSKSL